jgi:hypothetical protein
MEPTDRLVMINGATMWICRPVDGEIAEYNIRSTVDQLF